MPKKMKALTTIGFRLYLFPWGHAHSTAKGVVVLLDKRGRQSYGKRGSKAFNNWDEIPKAIRFLVGKTLGLKKRFDGQHWRLE